MTMTILLLQNATYIPTHGGANKANRLLLQDLVARGHECHVFAPAVEQSGEQAHQQFRKRLQQEVGDSYQFDQSSYCFQHNGVHAHLFTRRVTQVLNDLTQLTQRISPTWILVASEDPGQILLCAALQQAPSRVVSVCQTPLQLPFGHQGFMDDEKRAALFRQSAGVITISRYMQDYLRHWGKVEASVFQLPVFGKPPFPDYGSPDSGCVTLINPCMVKGLSIFLELAQCFPGVRFAGVTTWGTTASDREQMAAVSNIEIWEATDNMDQIYANTRILVVPSLWNEAFGYVAVEAMLRGIPILVSDVGGLPEAALGVGQVLPVRKIEHYQNRLDVRLMPVPVIPEQDVAEWAKALRRLLDKDIYTRVSKQGRAAALEYVMQSDSAAIETYLETLTPRQLSITDRRASERPAGSEATTYIRLNNLSAGKRALIQARLRAKQKQ